MSLSQRLAKIREAEAQFHRELQVLMSIEKMLSCLYCGKRHPTMSELVPREWRSR